MGNGLGVFIQDAPLKAIGGNIISGNDENGVKISGSTAIENAVRDNSIGTDTTGLALGNGMNGVLIEEAASNNTIGVTNRFIDQGNTIAFNGADGVAVLSGRGNRSARIPSSRTPNWASIWATTA